MRFAKPSREELFAAAEVFRRLANEGGDISDAMQAAIDALIRVQAKGLKVSRLVPKAVTETITGYLAFTYPGRWRFLAVEATSTLIRTEEVSQVRDELTLLLHKLGHKPPMIAAALNRHRTTTICALRDRLTPPAKKTRVPVDAWLARVDAPTVATKAAA